MSINFERAKTLMDLIHQITVVSPRSVNLLGIAAEELNNMEDEAKKELAEVAKVKADELVAATERVNVARREQEAERVRQEKTNIPQVGHVNLQSQPIQPVQIMPGEPINPLILAEAAHPGQAKDEVVKEERKDKPVQPAETPVRRNI